MCNVCGKQGDFAKCCCSTWPQGGARGRHDVHYVHTSENSGVRSQPASNAVTESSEEYLYTISRPKANIPHAKIKVGDCNTNMMLDTGGTVNIIDETT